MNKLHLNEKVINRICRYIEDKINIENVLPIYEFAKVFNVPSLQKASFIYIERCFTMIVESQNYLELDYFCVSKILASSELNTTSEHEVYNAVNIWLNYNIEKYSKFAKNLLLKVRFPLLSDHALKHISNKPFSSLCKIDDCVEVLNKGLEDRDSMYQHKFSTYYTNRYCSQELFNILICGGYGTKSYQPVQRVVEFNVNNPGITNNHPSMNMWRFDFKIVCLKAEVYVFGGDDSRRNSITSVDKYSPVTKTWNNVTDMYDDRAHFCTCAFMGSIYLVGGCYYEGFDCTITNSCLQFDSKDNNWKEVCGMKQERQYAAATVFEGRIVVSGGWDNNDNKLNSVEYYDFVVDSWTPMPNMIEGRSHHDLVAVKSKLFAIGGKSTGNTCEVLDSTCKTFVTLKSSIGFNAYKAVSIGSKFFIFQNGLPNIVSYDVDKDKWSENSCEATDNISYFSCVKLTLF